MSAEKMKKPGAMTASDSRWQAVLKRDLKADGNFFYSVESAWILPPAGRQNDAFLIYIPPTLKKLKK